MDKTTMPGMTHEDGEGLTRRQVLKTAAGAGLVLLLPMQDARAEDAPAQWTPVGKAEDFVKDTPQRVALANGDVLFVTRQSQDALVAVSAKCTHRGCEIGWRTDLTQFQCPCHGAGFAAGGKNVQGTQRQPKEPLPDLPTVATRLKDGQVEVNLGGVPADELQPRSKG